MVRRCLLLLLCLPLAALAESPRLWVELERTTLELGQPLSGSLHGTALERAPGRDDLLGLDEAFALVQVEPGADDGPGAHRLDFTLYPRRTGDLTLPPLRVGEAASDPQTVTVAAATTARGEPMQVSHHVSTDRPWVREQVLVTLEVITADAFASLRLDAESIPGFEAFPLPAERERVQTAAGERTRLRAGWALFPLAAGVQRPELPPVRYWLDGGTRRLLPLPSLRLEVEALPPYVPPTLPVGRIEVASRLESEGVLAPDALAWWRIEVSAPAIPAPWLPEPLRASSTEAVDLLPAQSEDASLPDADGLHARRVHRVPFKPQANGRLELPRIELQYFDPDSGRLERVIHRPPGALVLAPALRWILVGLAVTVLLAGLGFAMRLGRAAWLRHRARRAALKRLARSTDAPAMRESLRAYAAAEGWPANLPLEAWFSHWSRHYRADPQLEAALRRLNAAGFAGRGESDMLAVRAALLRGLRARRR